MHLAVIGFGNAGGKIADTIVETEAATGRPLTRFVLAVNTAEIDLAKLDAIPRERRLLIGQTDEAVRGRGVGSDPDLGAAVTRRDRAEIDRALDDLPVHEIDAFLVVAGLGGGTGSGGAPVLCRHLRETFSEPVYGLGVLPIEDEGGRASVNAARSLQTFVDATDNLLLFDNDAWQSAGDSLERGFERINEEIARRIIALLSPGEDDGSAVSEVAMDASDVRRTLSTGGVSTVAYATTDLEPHNRSRGLLDRLRTNGEHESADYSMKTYSLVRKAVQSRLTCPAEVESAERALLVVAGPSAEISRKGIQRGRQWLESQTDSSEVLAGDDPWNDATHLSATVLLSNVTDVPRIDRLQEQAVDAKSRTEANEETRDERIRDLVTDDGDELDPV